MNNLNSLGEGQSYNLAGKLINHKPSSIFLRYFSWFLLVSLIFIGFGLGLILGSNLKDSNFNQNAITEDLAGGKIIGEDNVPMFLLKDVNFDLFWQVWKEVRNNYVDPKIPETQMFYGALMGMVAALNDPYSIFLDPEITKDFQQELEGRFEGIGAEVAIKKDQLVVVAPLPNTPAEKAGLRAGDKILAIDNKLTQGLTVDEAVKLIRGPKETAVVLKITHEGSKDSEDISVIREEIKFDSVRWKMIGKNADIGYIELLYFKEDTAGALNQAVNSVLAAKNLKGIILDMRNNPGGYLDSAVQVSSLWVENGAVVLEEGRDGKRHEYPASGSAVLKDINTVVLVNNGSASASEIVAGALQDYKKAILVGETTFGKGSVQDYQTLPDGSSLKLTIAKWLTPLGRSINEEGIKPDIEIKNTPEDFNNDRDPQLDKAMEVIGDYNK